ncbi:amidohydrolase family protein [Pedobacter kyonggii]|uniref:Amidohydrolase n=1 Tax=Pedobacter kyonggii TaxID=1926871 RepID=A0A4Q9HGE0_9SPHI|nr:amidohydrolase family protein [Pedobacter kyonggii]TBO44296.1 amidohydrolase [Pedobacter kyonggii]
MVIDMHAHIAFHELYHPFFITGVQEEAFDVIGKSDIGLLNPVILNKIIKKRLDDQNCNELLAQMELAGISKTVLLIADWGYGLDESKLSLEYLYGYYHGILTKNPDKFIVFAGADPRRGDEGLHLFERGIVNYKFKGLKLYPPCGYELNDKRLYPYYELCGQYNIPVLTHTGPSLSSMKIEREYPSSICEVASQFSDVRFVLGHAAFQNFDVNLSIARKFKNVFLESSGFQKECHNEYFIKKSLVSLFRHVPNQVLFGTDWPMFNMMGTQKKWVDYFKDLNVMKDSYLELFFYKNAQEVLNLR